MYSDLDQPSQDVSQCERTSFRDLVERAVFIEQDLKRLSNNKISRNLTNWSIGIINFVAWLPDYKTVAEIPFQTVKQEADTLEKAGTAPNLHTRWQSVPLLLSMIQIMCYMLMLLLKRSALIQMRFDIFFYAGLLFTYSLFVSTSLTLR